MNVGDKPCEKSKRPTVTRVVNNEARIKCIEALQKLGEFWRATAESTALSAARYPKDKDKLADAVHYVALHDDRQKAACEAIGHVNAYWPTEQRPAEEDSHGLATRNSPPSTACDGSRPKPSPVSVPTR